MAESQRCKPSQAKTLGEEREETPVLESKKSWRNDYQPDERFLVRKPQGALHRESIEMSEVEVLCNQGGSVMVSESRANRRKQ